MDTNNLIRKTEEMVRGELTGESSGHDWWHIWRVWNIAKRIAQEEKVDMFVVELAALLHDIADWKANDGDLKAGGRVSRKWLESIGVEEEIIIKVVEIVDNVSYKGAGVEDKMDSLEGQVVQDADRLDAMGAIGIGRVFMYGGNKGREMYNPDNKVVDVKDFDTYKKAGQTSINHFYEKLLLLKDRMHTKTAKRLAEQRHSFMDNYLEEFYAEWSGEK